MGLHINYELALPAAATETEAQAFLVDLRAACEALGASKVGPIMELTERDLAEGDQRYAPWTTERFAWAFARGSRESRDGRRTGDANNERAALVFFLYPGEGSEAAALGLVSPTTWGAADAERADLQGRWYWYGHCKTQYASRVSEEHLVHCHLVVVKALEAAARLGATLEVHDETGYWETRSVDRLLVSVRNMNRIVARFAGAFHDAVGGAHSVESPIFEDPDFERLESEPLDKRADTDGG
jgi:hypothetical protein